MRFELEATIPTTQYGNIKPKFTKEDGEDEAAFTNAALEAIRSLWYEYGEKPLSIRKSFGTKVSSFTGENLYYNDEQHTYYSEKGQVLLSGSAYARSISPKFDKETILPKTAKAWGVTEEDLSGLWDKSNDVSKSYGTAIHDALEAYHNYKEIGAKIQEAKKLEHNYALPKNEHLRKIVLDFDTKFGTNALTEILVSDVANLRAGRIDRLEIIDKDAKVCRVGDYKTNNELTDKKKLEYQHQLSFYANILMNFGWNVLGLDIYHYDNGWEKIEFPVLDLVTA